MKTRYNITLSESDLLIIAWKRKIMEAKPSEMSALIKDAILTFIETGTFIDIGHIHFNPEQEIFKKGNSIVLLTARTPIINDWINENVKEGLGISQPIKILLKECIKVVPEEQEEYFLLRLLHQHLPPLLALSPFSRTFAGAQQFLVILQKEKI